MTINIIFILYLFFELIQKVKIKSSTINIKFMKYISSTINDYLLSNYNNDIYISLKVGNPHQNIEKIFLKSDTYEFMIANKTIEKKNYNNSESYTSKIIALSQYYQLKYTYKGYAIKDHFYLNNQNNKIKELQNITFLYASKINFEKFTAVLGLKLDEEGVKKVKPFPEQLNELKYLEESTWMIQYTSDNEGNFFLGEILSKNVFPKFSLDEYRKTNAIISGHYLSWDLLFSQIKYNNIILNGPLQANLDFNFGLISCSNEYYNNIKNDFFNEYLDKGICQEYLYDYENEEKKIESIKNTFNYIICENSLKIKKFPELYFYHTELDFVFELNYKDFFLTYNDKIYFLCINVIKTNDKWVFGKPFFKKYNLIFDYKAKTIGLYGNYSKNKMNWILFEWIIVILLFLVFIYLAYTLIRRYRLRNYKTLETILKVHELNEEFDKTYNFKEIKEENKIIEDK